MSIAAPAIEVTGLVKQYGSRRVVDGLSFSVEPGEIFALLGPNGAGKTTTVEMLEGYRRSDGGTLRVLGLDPARDGKRLRSRIGVMLQEGGLYPAITPREALTLFAQFYREHEAPETLLDTVGLNDAAGTRYRRLSGGQKQRLALALALLPKPDLVFLDEPTAGLDPQARRDTWAVVERLRDHGVTVILTTHYLEEAERLADRVAIIDAGRLVTSGTPRELLGTNTSQVRARFHVPVEVDMLSSLPSVSSVRTDGDTYILEVDDAPEALAQVSTLARDRRVPIAQLTVGTGSLEDLFLQLTGKHFS